MAAQCKVKGLGRVCKRREKVEDSSLVRRVSETRHHSECVQEVVASRVRRAVCDSMHGVHPIRVGPLSIPLSQNDIHMRSRTIFRSGIEL